MEEGKIDIFLSQTFYQHSMFGNAQLSKTGQKLIPWSQIIGLFLMPLAQMKYCEHLSLKRGLGIGTVAVEL